MTVVNVLVTLTRRREILGDDHIDTLTSANNLAVDLWALGRSAFVRHDQFGHVDGQGPRLGEFGPLTGHELAVEDVAAGGRVQAVA